MRMVPKYIAILATALVPLGAGTRADDAQEQAVKYVEKLGGTLRRNEDADKKPVVIVDLVSTAIDDAGVKRLLAFKELQELHLDACDVGDAGVRELIAFEKLQKLNLSGSKVTDTGLKDLSKLKQLQFLKLGSTSVSDKGLKELTAFDGLRYLSLDTTSITDAGLKELASLKHLETLILRGTTITDAGLKELAGMNRLQRLNLSNTRITDAGLKELAGLSNLNDLRLSRTAVTDAAMKDLAPLKKLEWLDLAGTEITDNSLKELVEVKQLQSLDLGNTKISDAGMAHVAKLKQLRFLDINDTKVTDAGMAEVRKALPEVIITVKKGSSPTDAEVKEMVERLELKNDMATKLEASKWLREHAKAKNTELAIEALETLVHKDSEPGVRGEAIVALMLIGQARKRPCPLVLVEALLDEDDYVVSCAGGIGNFFTTYAPGSVDVLMRCADSKREMVRQNAPLLLLSVGGKDKTILDKIEALQEDKCFNIRHNAHVAMFKANDNFSDYLHWIIQVEEDPDSVLSLDGKDADAVKKERKTRELIVLGMAMQLRDWQSAHPEGLAKGLIKLLDDKSPSIRRGAARLIGVEYLKNPHQETDHEKSLCAPYLDKLKAEERLMTLLETEKDETVRRSVNRALERMASVKEK